MFGGVATLFQKHLCDTGLDGEQRVVLQSAYERFFSRDPGRAWTTGQRMTERPGGSDMSRTETLATFSPSAYSSSKAADGNVGPWLIDSFQQRNRREHDGYARQDIQGHQ